MIGKRTCQEPSRFLQTFAKVLCGGGKFKITKQGHASFFHNDRNEISAQLLLSTCLVKEDLTASCIIHNHSVDLFFCMGFSCVFCFAFPSF